MSLTAWILFVVTETALCFSPGPAVLFVLSQALTRGPSRTTCSIGGILGANTVYFVLSGTGIGAILMASWELFFAIKWIGAAYLVWLGASTFFSRSPVLSVAGAPGGPVTRWRMFLNGFVLQMANPKALVFFTALLPQFIDPRAAVGMQIGVLAVTSVVIEFLVLLFYATLAGRVAHLAMRPRFSGVTSRIAGSLLIGAGIGLAAVRRT